MQSQAQAKQLRLLSQSHDAVHILLSVQDNAKPAIRMKGCLFLNTACMYEEFHHGQMMSHELD